MASTEVQICNMALARIQGTPITDLETDDSTAAVLCRTMYEPTRDAVLEDHPWSFALARQVLAVSTDENLSSWVYAYALPEDPYCIRPLVLLDPINGYLELPGYPFRKEGRRLLTDMEGAGLKYISRVIDPVLFSALFTDALAWRLAAELLKPIEGTTSVDLWAMYRDVLLSAEGANDQAAQEPDLTDLNWIEGRFGGR
jgi:hypothetical protein